MTLAEELAQLIADEIAAQGNETDNLGDNESLVLVGETPTINLTQLAERIIAYPRNFQESHPTTVAGRLADHLEREGDMVAFGGYVLAKPKGHIVDAYVLSNDDRQVLIDALRAMEAEGSKVANYIAERRAERGT